MAVAGVLFDLDGVLVDSRVPFAGAVNAALAANGLPERPAAELHGFIGPPLHETFERLGAGARVQACVDSYRERYVAVAARETPVFPGVRELLAALPAPLGVATSKPRALAEPLLEALGLREHFVTVCGPDLDAEHEPKSVTVARALECVAASALVGDRRHDMVAAREHGLTAIGVLWGIGSERELLDAGADALVRDPGEIVPLLTFA